MFDTSLDALGQSVVDRLANARAQFATGDPVQGFYARRPAVAALGQPATGRDRSFACRIAMLPPGIAEGSTVTVYYGDQLVTPEGNYTVRERLDTPETGIARLELRKAA